ncbi:MAG TPA: TolC family protein [Bryobacteraceae bacterium]|nr:TolC family protein [Bryobacteraceae bacterium]
MRILVLLAISALSGWAETRTMTLKQVVDLALQQNADVMLSRLDAQKARSAVNIARDPFSPKVYAGSGAAYTTGYPANIEGEAPSIFQVRTQMAIFDRPQSYQIAEANENLRGSEIDTAKQQDEVAYRVASTYLDAEQVARNLEVARRQAENFARVVDIMKARQQEGRELPIEVSRASVALSKAKLTVATLEDSLADAEESLAMLLGMAPGDRVSAAQEERPAFEIPASEPQAIAAAIESSKEIRRMESSMQAKMLDTKSYRAQRLPKVDLIAQDEVFAKYYYQDYYTKFQRNSAQFGASIEVPLWVGRSARAYISQDEADIEKLRIEIRRTRSQITDNVRRAFEAARHADLARDVARDDLALAREQVSVDLAQNEEGRLPMATLEQARAAEDQKWIAYYDAQNQAERARLDVLRHTGTLVTALK